MNKRDNLLKGIILSILFCAIFSGIISAPTYAEKESPKEIYKQVLLNQMRQCYDFKEMHASVEKAKYLGFETSMLYIHASTKNMNSTRIFIPSYIGTGNNLGRDVGDRYNGTPVPRIGCYELFLGDKYGQGYKGTFTGIFELLGKTPAQANSGEEKINEFVVGMGYTEENPAELHDFSDCYVVKKSFKTEIGRVCFDVNQYDKIGFKAPDGQNDKYVIEKFDKSYTFKLGGTTETKDSSGNVIAGSRAYLTVGKGSSTCKGDDFSGPDSTIHMDGGFANDLMTNEKLTKCLKDKFELNVEHSAGETQQPVVYENTWPGAGNNSSAAYKHARSYLTGQEGLYEMNDDRKYTLYMWYLTEVYQANKSDKNDCEEDKPSTLVGDDAYYIKTESGWCPYVVSEEEANEYDRMHRNRIQVSAYTSGSQKYILDGAVTLEELVNLMGELNPSDEVLTNPSSFASEINSAEGDSENEPACTDNAGALGWIACPAVTSLADAIQDIYEKYIVNFLKIDPMLFDENGGGQNIYKAWQVFQNLANLIFVAAFVVVIFSQITGFGVDNYGIKKSLPKLIVGAILINLSFLICALAVDVSNIVGYGIGALFNQIQPQKINVMTVSTSDAASGLISFAAGGTAVLGFLSVVAGAFSSPVLLSSGGIALILPILLGLLSVFLAILFIFIVLSIRQALAVLLVVVSPVAFVCYILPNTKSIFQRWYKALTGLLLCFPIVSAVIYGGQSIGQLVLTATGESSAPIELIFSAVIVSIAPVFMVPSLIRKSMDGIVGIGAMIGRMEGYRGRALRGAERSLGGSRIGRARARAMEEGRRTQMIRDAERTVRRYGDGRTLTRRQSRQLNAAAAVLGRENIQETDAYADMYGRMGQDRVRDLFNDDNSIENNFMSRNGEFDFNRIDGALANLNGRGRIDAINKLKNNGAYQKAMANRGNQQRMAAIFAKGDTATEKALADAYRKGNWNTCLDGSGQFNWGSGGLRDYANDQGAEFGTELTKHDMADYGIMSNLTEAQFSKMLSREYSAGSDLEQAALSATTGYLTGKGTNARDNLEAVVGSMSAEDLSGMSANVYRKLRDEFKAGGKDFKSAINSRVYDTIADDTTGRFKGKMNSEMLNDLFQSSTSGSSMPTHGSP